MPPRGGYSAGPLKVNVTGRAKVAPSGPRRKAPATAPRAVLAMGVMVNSIGEVTAPAGIEIDSAPSGVESVPPSAEMLAELGGPSGAPGRVGTGASPTTSGVASPPHAIATMSSTGRAARPRCRRTTMRGGLYHHLFAGRDLKMS